MTNSGGACEGGEERCGECGGGDACLDATMVTEQRVATTKQLIGLLLECTLRADRDRSTAGAAEDLRAGVKKIMKQSGVKEEVGRLLQWPVFSSKAPEKKRWLFRRPQEQAAGFVSSVPLPGFVSSALPQVAPSVPTQAAPAPGIRLKCTHCGRFGHVEATCYTKHPELRRGGVR